MRKILAIFIFSLIIASCTSISETCTVYCYQIDLWIKSCNLIQTDMNYSECYNHYSARNWAYDQQFHNRQECWHKLATWIVASGGERIDCSQMPPRYNEVEREKENEKK